MCVYARAYMHAYVCVKQANLVLITLYLFHQCCALAYFHSYKFTALPSVVIDDPLILAHLWRLWARKEVSERQQHHVITCDGQWNFPCPQNYICTYSILGVNIKGLAWEVFLAFFFLDKEFLIFKNCEKKNLWAEQAIWRSERKSGSFSHRLLMNL